MNVKHVLSFVLAATLSGSLAFAQQPDGGQSRMGRGPGGWGMGFHIGPPGAWWHNPDLIQKLNLTPDQQKKMDDIFQQSRLQLVDLRAALEKQEIQMRPMLSANPPDTNKVLAQIDQIAQARAELEKADAKMLLGIRNVLSPDQWTKLQEEGRNHMREMRRGGRGPGQGGSGGPGGEGMD